MHKKQKIKWLLGEGSPGHTSEQGLVRRVFHLALTQTLSKGKWIHIGSRSACEPTGYFLIFNVK